MLQDIVPYSIHQVAVQAQPPGSLPVEINFATVVTICRAYLKQNGDKTEMIFLIRQCLKSIGFTF